MKATSPRLQRGSGWLEFSVVTMAIAVIGWFWIGALLDLQADGEKTAVDLTVRNMRTGLQLRMAEMMLENKVKEIPALAGQNPVQWLAQPPEHYLGELDAPPHDPAPRSWYFNRATRTLMYYPGAARFDRVSGESGPLAWRIVPGSGTRDGGMAGIRLAQVPQ